MTAGTFFDSLLECLKVISSCDAVSACGVGCAIDTVNKQRYLHQAFLLVNVKVSQHKGV